MKAVFKVKAKDNFGETVEVQVKVQLPKGWLDSRHSIKNKKIRIQNRVHDMLRQEGYSVGEIRLQ